MKISDSLEIRDYAREREERKQKRTIATIVLIIIVIIIGVVTFLISNSIINSKKKEEPIQDIKLNINDENVTILYQYVSHEINGVRNDKFVSNKSITLNDFKTEEKYYYALQFAQVEDFEFTGEFDEHKNKIYFISNKKIKEYMELFFGPKITYRTDMTITYPFSFKINRMSLGTMTYNDEREGFDVVFSLVATSKSAYPPFYTALDSAVQKEDGSIVIREKILYTKVNVIENKFNMELYKDPDYGIQVETINNIEKDKIDSYIIDMENKNNTGFIEYTFALNDNNIYYFQSSRHIND